VVGRVFAGSQDAQGTFWGELGVEVRAREGCLIAEFAGFDRPREGRLTLLRFKRLLDAWERCMREGSLQEMRRGGEDRKRLGCTRKRITR
jgi:hypothetical protein